MKYKVSAIALAIMVPFGAHAQQPTLEQNVDAMTSKGISIIAAFHDTIVGLSNANTQLANELETVKKERDRLKAEQPTK